MIRDCVACSQKLSLSFIPDHDGYCHPWCYARRHPFVPKTTFAAVLNNSDDPVLVRELLQTFVPEHIQRAIVASFNAKMRQRSLARVTPPEVP